MAAVLEYASEEMKVDKEVVLAAVTQEGYYVWGDVLLHLKR